MGILVDGTTRVLVQGISGRAATFHLHRCLAYGTRVVAGVRPGKGGQLWEECIPIYDSVRDALERHRVDASLVFVPAAQAADALMEAIDGAIPLVVCIAEGIPSHDMLLVRERLACSHSRLIGPNCPGIIAPGQAKLGIMPGEIHSPGRVGVVSRSGTLTFETVSQLTRLGIGQSTCVGIGGDPIHGLSLCDVVQLFAEDPETDGIILVGEIGGEEELDAAEHIRRHVTKPVVAFIAGVSSPPGRRMGHAGAIVSGKRSGAAYKIDALERAGICVARHPGRIALAYRDLLGSP
ncbi:MAG: succinate--CoA ligase subunit alpha [Puniceicoccales bacterium]|jgi:succinyl-CoA synthetase alpha subunit|nr:succinate--CoA ligase subunit alpha [Puniceicoccales bacterium]